MTSAQRWYLAALQIISIGTLFGMHSRMLSFASLTVGKMADDTGVTSSAFIRHMGIICRNGQCAVDCILPVLLWDTQICKHVITAVLIQFKQRKCSGTITAYSINESEIGFFPKTLEECTHGSAAKDYRPYIGMIMELGVQTVLHDNAKIPTIFRPNEKPSVKKIPSSEPRTLLARGGDANSVDTVQSPHYSTWQKTP